MADASNRRTTPDDGINLYTTPPWAVEALLKAESIPKNVWEPCCGMGHISKVLVEAGHNVTSSDLYDHGYGEPDVDFLAYTDDEVECVITNPPFDKAKINGLSGTHMAMLDHALSMENVKKVCFFLPIQFLETPGRADFLESCPHFSKVYSFADRVKCLTKGDESLSKDNTSKHYAWFVFDKANSGPATVHFLRKPEELKKRKPKKKADK